MLHQQQHDSKTAVKNQKNKKMLPTRLQLQVAKKNQLQNRS